MAKHLLYGIPVPSYFIKHPSGWIKQLLVVFCKIVKSLKENTNNIITINVLTVVIVIVIISRSIVVVVVVVILVESLPVKFFSPTQICML